MSPLPRRALWVSLFGGAAIIVSLFIAPGCTMWRTRQYGDATLRRENYHFRSISIGVRPASRDILLFPQVSLDAPRTNVFRVRSFPTNQSVQGFALVLPKKASGLGPENTALPWYQTRIRIMVRNTNGLEVFTRQIALDNLPQWNWETRGYETKPRRRGWNEAWDLAGLAEAVRGKRDYDLTVIIKKPSSGKTDAIQFRGTGVGW